MNRYKCLTLSGAQRGLKNVDYCYYRKNPESGGEVGEKTRLGGRSDLDHKGPYQLQ